MNNCSYKRQGILFIPNKVDRDQIQRTRCLCKNPVFIFHCIYPECMPDMLMS